MTVFHLMKPRSATPIYNPSLIKEGYVMGGYGFINVNPINKKGFYCFCA